MNTNLRSVLQFLDMSVYFKYMCVHVYLYEKITLMQFEIFLGYSK